MLLQRRSVSYRHEPSLDLRARQPHQDVLAASKHTVCSFCSSHWERVSDKLRKMKTLKLKGDADHTDHQTVICNMRYVVMSDLSAVEGFFYSPLYRVQILFHVFLRSSKNVFAPSRVEYTRQHERQQGSYQQHTFTSLLIFTQWVPTTWQHQHKRKRIWKCNITTFSELNEKYKVSLCSIFCLQGYWDPAWTHTVLALARSLRQM